MLINQACVTNHILSFEDDDVYFTKKDIVSEEEMEKYLEKKNKVDDPIIEEDTEVEEVIEYEF